MLMYAVAPVMYRAGQGHKRMDIVKLLLSKGANVNVKNHEVGRHSH